MSQIKIATHFPTFRKFVTRGKKTPDIYTVHKPKFLKADLLGKTQEPCWQISSKMPTTASKVRASHIFFFSFTHIIIMIQYLNMIMFLAPF